MFTRKFDRRVRAFGLVTVFAVVTGLSFGTYALWPANVELLQIVPRIRIPSLRGINAPNPPSPCAT